MNLLKVGFVWDSWGLSMLAACTNNMYQVIDYSANTPKGGTQEFPGLLTTNEPPTSTWKRSPLRSYVIPWSTVREKTIGTAVGPCRKSILMSEIHTAVMFIPVDLQVFPMFWRTHLPGFAYNLLGLTFVIYDFFRDGKVALKTFAFQFISNCFLYLIKIQHMCLLQEWNTHVS